MAWFSKPRGSEHQTAARCARCRERPGTALVHFVAAKDAPPAETTGRVAWLCDACQAELRRRADDN